MDFKAFTDQLLAANVSTSDMAEVLGVTQSTVLRARMDPTNKHARNPPPDWDPKLRELARQRSVELARLADG